MYISRCSVLGTAELDATGRTVIEFVSYLRDNCTINIFNFYCLYSSSSSSSSSNHTPGAARGRAVIRINGKRGLSASSYPRHASGPRFVAPEASVSPKCAGFLAGRGVRNVRPVEAERHP